MRYLFILLVIILAFGFGKYLYDAVVQEKTATAVSGETRQTPQNPKNRLLQKRALQKQKAVPAKPAAPVKASQEAPPETRPLDLSLPDSSDHNDVIDLQSKQNLLPDMFDKSKQTNKQRVSVSGSPILKPEEDGKSLPKLDGVTVDIEVKTE